MRHLYILILLVLFNDGLSSQCNITATADKLQLLCGDCVSLTAYGAAAGSVAFSENFNSGSPSGWAFTQTADFSNPCSPNGVDGTPHMWMGSSSSNPRDIETVAFNLSLGGTICFDMLYAAQGGASPCEGPDEPSEGVYLQYSTNGGTTWTTIHYEDPNGGNDPSLTNWNTYCFPLPSGAMTANTKIRWHQDAVSGAAYDHWGIDNVQITLNDPSSQVTWMHDNYTYGIGNPGGVNPTPICIGGNDSSFIVRATNGTVTCFDTITIASIAPTIDLVLPNDAAICPGDCLDLTSTANVIKSPGGTKLYENNQVSIVTGTSADVNINVTGMNATSISAGLITQVCVNGFSYSGTQLCSNFSGCQCNGSSISIGQTCTLDESSFELILSTPDGCQITLVPAGVATAGGYNNVCFVPVGGSSITGGAFPASGNFTPNQALSGLNGCQTNGVWTLSFNSPGGALGFGFGQLDGWAITFDDPEISYEAFYSWSPTTNMTNPNSLNPNVCPNSFPVTYTLTATDSNNCVTVSDDVTITQDASCCPYNVTSTISNSICGACNGQITLNVTGSSGYTYQWSANANNATTASVSNLCEGTYTVNISDVTSCVTSLSFTISDSSTFSLDTTNFNITNASCGVADGGISGIITNGGQLTYSWVELPSLNPVGNGINLQNVPIGTYALLITDVTGCTDYTGPYTITNSNGPQVNVANAQIVNVACSNPLGSISNLMVSQGSAPYSYFWINSQNDTVGNSINLTNALEGTYVLHVLDANGCIGVSSPLTILNEGVVILDVIKTNPSCGKNDGSIQLVVSGGVAPISYQWGPNAGNQTVKDLSNLATGTYCVTITDANNCQTDSCILLNGAQNVVADFNISDNSLELPNTLVSLTDNSSSSVTTWKWYIYDDKNQIIDSIIGTKNPTYTFPKVEGEYSVELVVTNGGCVDNITLQVDVEAGEEIIFIPNTFSPNQDGFNEYFSVYVDKVKEYKLEIFDRWGQLVYSTTDVNAKGWDGKYKGSMSPDDAYIWKVTYEPSNSVETKIKLGHLFLLK